MGLILDTSVLIAGERRGDTLAEILRAVRFAYPGTQEAISAITLVELDHRLYRARSERDRAMRKIFTDEVATDLVCYPVDRNAHIAGRVEGQLAAMDMLLAWPISSLDAPPCTSAIPSSLST